MELVCQCIDSAPYDIDLYGFCHLLTKTIYSKYVEFNIDIERLKQHPEERLTASAVIYSSKFRQIWMIGDCQCLIGSYSYDNPKPFEEEMSNKRSLFLLNAIDNGITIDEIRIKDIGREHILPQLIECCSRQNLDYAVIDGFDIPKDKVRVINVGNNVNQIVLASDGYPFLKPTLQESEAALSFQLMKDPLCIDTFKATKGLMAGYKSFDDRSFLCISI